MNAIQISGGVDSLAMLWLLREQWPQSIVMWCNTGAAYSETIEMMDRIKAIVPHFRTVYGDQPNVIKRGGFPADVVPIRHSLLGELAFGHQDLKFQPFTDCCRQSIWEPMHRASISMGVDTIYRGQRKDETYKAQLSNGFVDQFGVRYLFPINEWSKKRVFDYVNENCPQELIPTYYGKGEPTSRDCWNCTAYLRDNMRRIENLPEGQRKVVEARLERLREAVKLEMR